MPLNLKLKQAKRQAPQSRATSFDCRWLSKRSLDGGLTSLKLSASFEEGTGKEKEDCCNQQLTQGLAFLLPTLAATVGNSCVPLHLTLSGQCC